VVGREGWEAICSSLLDCISLSVGHLRSHGFWSYQTTYLYIAFTGIRVFSQRFNICSMPGDTCSPSSSPPSSAGTVPHGRH
jgi:hypothetical protein